MFVHPWGIGRNTNTQVCMHKVLLTEDRVYEVLLTCKVKSTVCTEVMP